MAARVSVNRRKRISALVLALGVTLPGTVAASPAQATVSVVSGGMSTTGSTDTQYSVTIVNKSAIDDENAIVFQQQPSQPSDVHSLAWLSKMCHAGTSVTFTWEVDYNFVWGQTGTLKPGVNYDAGQVISADLEVGNTVSLSYVDDGFEFGKPTSGAAGGSLVINEDDTVPGPDSSAQGSVGIGMSGAGTFVVSTQPDTGVEFEITPTYWLAFGSYKAGTVVSEDILTKPYQLQFPDGETSAVATFDGKNWTVQYGG